MKKFLVFLFCLLSMLLPAMFSMNTYALSFDADSLGFFNKYKDISKNYILIAKMKKVTENLSQEDKNIITKYVYGAVKGENTYLLINCYLRGTLSYYIKQSDITKSLKSRMKYYSDCLTAAVTKSKLPRNMILYRGVDEKGMVLIFKDKNIKNTVYHKPTEKTLQDLQSEIMNAEFTEKGFMSAAYDINYAKQTKFIFVINAPKNMHAVLVDGLDRNKNKPTKEILINKGYKWKVFGVDLSQNKKGEKIYKINLKYVKV